MKKNFLILYALTFSVMIIQNSCAKESEEDILGGYEYCKDSLVSFSENVQPILLQDCGSCHSGPDAENGVELDSYDGVTLSVTPELLMDCINHRNGEIPMPQGRPKLNDCKIATIQKWIDEGMLDN